jgi:hypothetical protein
MNKCVSNGLPNNRIQPNAALHAPEFGGHITDFPFCNSCGKESSLVFAHSINLTGSNSQTMSQEQIWPFPKRVD